MITVNVSSDTPQDVRVAMLSEALESKGQVKVIHRMNLDEVKKTLQSNLDLLEEVMDVHNSVVVESVHIEGDEVIVEIVNTL